MANETARATLTQMLYKYAGQRGNILSRIQGCRDRVSDAEANYRRAQDAEREAIYDDDQLMAKKRALIAYYNSLPTGQRPQAILEQDAEMARQQLETHRKRIASHEVVREALRVLEECQRDLAIAEQDEKTISDRIRETDTEIERLNRRS
jgi:hypothetical protein